MESTITCYYQSKNLAKVYQHYRANTEKSEQHYLLAKLPTSYKKVKIDADFAETIYRPTKTDMSIDQQFTDGVTNLDFSRISKNTTKVMTQLLPD